MMILFVLALLCIYLDSSLDKSLNLLVCADGTYHCKLIYTYLINFSKSKSSSPALAGEAAGAAAGAEAGSDFERGQAAIPATELKVKIESCFVSINTCWCIYIRIRIRIHIYTVTCANWLCLSCLSQVFIVLLSHLWSISIFICRQ